MKAKKYVKVPVEVEAMQWTRDTAMADLKEFTRNLVELDDTVDHFQVYDRLHDTWVNFTWDDWIIKGVKGEFYPCAAEVFAETYREAITSVTTVSGKGQVTIYPRQYGKQASIAEQMRRQGF